MTFSSNSARFLWKSIPSAIKENQPEVVAAWKIGQRLWMRDYAGVHEAIRGFDWSQQAQSLVSSFSGMFSHFAEQGLNYLCYRVSRDIIFS